MEGLSGTDPSFPRMLWDTLIKQHTITINLLRRSRINPRLSAHAQIFWQFNYDTTPLALPGCKCVLHEKPSARGTWEIHSVNAYCTALQMIYCRHYDVRVEKTLAKRTSDNITFLPHNISMPNTVSKIEALERIEDLVKLLQCKPSPPPFEQNNDPTLIATYRLAEVFDRRKVIQ